jgi:integrase
MTPSAFEKAARAAIATRAGTRTREHYLRVLDLWLKHCHKAAVDPADPRQDASAAFRDGLQKRRTEKGKLLEPATIRNYMSALSFIYSRLMSTRPPTATWNPFDPKFIERPKVSQEGKTESLPDGVAERMIEAAQTAGALRDVAILRMLYDTGVRRMTVASLKRDKLFTRDGALVARVVVKGSGGADLHEVTLPAATVAALKAWLVATPESPFVFPSRDGHRSIDLSTINKVVARWAKVVGARRVHPHRFRSTFATDAFDAGADARAVQGAMHHADPRSTQRYDRGRRGTEVTRDLAKWREKGTDNG